MMKLKKRYVFVLIFLSVILLLMPFVFFLNKKTAYYAYKEVTYRTIINNIISPEDNSKTVSLKFLNYFYENLFTPFGAIVEDKDVFNDLIRGVAWCDQRSWAMGTFLGKVGIDNRMIMINNPDGVSNHTVLEVFINDKWRLFDPFTKIEIYDNKELVSLSDVNINPSLFYMSSKMQSLKAVDSYSYEKKKQFYTKNVYYNNPVKASVWKSPVETKDFKRVLISGILDFYTNLFGHYFSNIYQDVYLSMILNSKDHNFKYLSARNYDLYGRTSLALKSYEDFISNYPFDKDIENGIFYFGVLLHKESEIEKSISVLTSLENKKTDGKWRAVLSYYLGLNNEILKKYDLAMKYFLQSIDMYKGHSSYKSIGIKIDDTNVLERLHNLSDKKIKFLKSVE